jgi:hypothetical protein
MGARCDLDMNNIVTTSFEDLPPEEQQRYKAVQEYMHVCHTLKFPISGCE